jgi:acetoin utilization deacetylase AcuC-like enzyme
MTATGATGIVEDPRYREHRGPAGHPERPDRLSAVHAAIAAREPELKRIAARVASDEKLLRVHTRAHLAAISDAARQAPTQLDPDTYVSPASEQVARLAAGGAIELAKRVARGELHNGLAAVRPPGHHAEAGQAMGFCLFNNAAVAAEALRAEEGLERILILDWDVHHGNGTQHCFEADRDVLYASTHQFPHYPGTGAAIEAGRDAGLGATVNVPMPAGCGDAEHVGALHRVLVPVAHSFQPEFLLVSCGFDAHRDDPLAAMQVSETGYRDMAELTRALAEEICGGRLVVLLEGGYAPSGLEEGTRAVLDALLDPDPTPPPVPELTPGSPLDRIVAAVVSVPGSRVPGLGAG